MVCLQEIGAGHFGWFGYIKQVYDSRSDVFEGAVAYFDILDVIGNVIYWHGVIGVRGVWASIGVQHFFNFTMVGGYDYVVVIF